MSIVAGLDLSLTNSGIAVLTDGRPTLLTSVGHGGKNGASWEQRSRRIVSQSRAVMAALQQAVDPPYPPGPWTIDLAVIEGPSYASEFGDQFDRAALWWGVYSALSAKRVPIAVVAPKTRAKWATGKDVEGNGNSKKRAVFAAVKDEWSTLGVHVRDDDIADALTIAAMGALKLGEPLPIAVHQWRINGLESVTWPSVVTV